MASNIAAGKGVTQSAINFNQSLDFDADPQIPYPYIAQPAVYPILLSIGIKLGFTPLASARIISILSILGILAGMVALSYLTNNARHAYLFLILTTLFLPFRSIIAYVWTEPLALAFLLFSISIYLLYVKRLDGRLLLLSGFLAGLAAGTRFVLALLFVVYLLDQFLHRSSWKKLISNSFLLLSTGSITIIPVLVYTYLVTGRMLPEQLPTDKSFWTNVSDVFSSMFTEVFYYHGTLFTIGLVILLLIGFVLFYKWKKMTESLSLSDRRIFQILFTWSISYLVVVIIQRSITFFSPLNSRILIMVTIFFLFAIGYLLIKQYQNHMVILNALYLMMVIFGCYKEVVTLVNLPGMNPILELSESSRIKWLRKNTTPEDLILGDNTVDVALLRGNDSVSFSAVPYTYNLQYEPLSRYLSRHCAEYPKVYMVIQNLIHKNYELDLKYGSFIADLLNKDYSHYKEFNLIDSPPELIIYQISCMK